MPTETTQLEIVAPEAQLVAYAEKTGLAKAATGTLVDAFKPHFIAARTALDDAIGVAESVKDATCLTEIKKSRACRLVIRQIRIASEKTRKEQKEAALTFGRAVDGFHNILLADITPVETALQNAEDTAERAETARKDKVEEERKEALLPFVADVALYAVRDMAEPVFAALLSGVKLAKEQADAAAAKAAADKLAKEQADAAERERIRAENTRLKAEADAKEAQLRAERLAAETAAKAAKAQADAQIARQKAITDKLAAEARAATLQREREAAAAAKAAKAAAAAPDADKLRAFAAALRAMPYPEFATEEGKAVGRLLSEQAMKFAAWVDTKADSLAPQSMEDAL